MYTVQCVIHRIIIIRDLNGKFKNCFKLSKRYLLSIPNTMHIVGMNIYNFCSVFTVFTLARSTDYTFQSFRTIKLILDISVKYSIL